MDIAINAIADNIGEVSEELLGSMPTQLVWRIWRFLEARFVGFILRMHSLALNHSMVMAGI